MDSHEYAVGMRVEELDTPALLVDMDTVEKNVKHMSKICAQQGVQLRPHAKIYKATPYFAWMQLRAGAIGITVAKLDEAEILAASGIKDILIANQIVGERKIRRLVNLAAYTNIIVAVDNLNNIEMISTMANERGVEVGLLVEVDIGNNRCGVEPYEETKRMTKHILSLPGLKFRGIMGYDGHLAFEQDKAKKYRQSIECYKLLMAVKLALVTEGIQVDIVSGGGSSTYKSAIDVKGLTELQAGTYIFSDTKFNENGLADFDCALSVLATVVSRSDRPGSEDMAVLDVGRKAISTTYGFPQPKSVPGGEIYSMPQEHSRLRVPKGVQLEVGDKVEIWVSDANETVNLYDRMYAIRHGVVEAVFEIYARGGSK